MLIFLKYGDRHSFCPNDSEVYCLMRTARSMHHNAPQTAPVFVVSAFLLGLKLTMDII